MVVGRSCQILYLSRSISHVGGGRYVHGSCLKQNEFPCIWSCLLKLLLESGVD